MTVNVRIIDGDQARLIVGGVWSLVVRVYDDWNGVDEPAVTVTRPDGSTATPPVTRTRRGLYVVDYVATTAGRHTLVATTVAYGAAAAVAFVSAVTAANAMPDLDACTDYLGETSATDAEISDALEAEAAAQLSACRIPATYPADLRQALLRRVARNLAMRGIPLAVLQGDAEGGDATMLPGADPEVRRLERPWRRLKMG